MKAREHKSGASSSMREKSRRGRPSNAVKDRILREPSTVLADEFRLYPLRAPVDTRFLPYHEQMLKGNANAILDYYLASHGTRELGASFHELLGRLFTVRYFRIADTILSEIERRGVWYAPSALDSYRYWYKRLKPLCEKAQAFIRAAYGKNYAGDRETLWKNYVFQPLPNVRFIIFRGVPDEDTLQQRENADQQKKRRSDLEELIRWCETPRKMRLADEPKKPALFQVVNALSPYGLVPKDVFFDLALSKMREAERIILLSPAKVARRYACKIAGISESTASHAGGK